MSAPLLRCALLGALLLGCAGEQAVVEYYALEPAPVAQSTTTAAAQAIRLTPIRVARHIGERIIWILEDGEAGYYPARRWLTVPENAVEQAVTQELFERRGLTRTTDVSAWRLDLDLLTFAEVLGPAHVAQVVARVTLTDPDGRSHLVHTFDVKTPIAGEATHLVAKAMSESVARLAAQVGEAVSRTLAAAARPPEARR